MLYLLPALTTLFPALKRTFPAFITLFLVNIFHNTEVPKVPGSIPKYLPYYYFLSCFTESLTPSINTSEFSSDFIILIISSISSNEMTKVIPFPVLTASFP